MSVRGIGLQTSKDWVLREGGRPERTVTLARAVLFGLEPLGGTGRKSGIAEFDYQAFERLAHKTYIGTSNVELNTITANHGPYLVIMIVAFLLLLWCLPSTLPCDPDETASERHLRCHTTQRYLQEAKPTTYAKPTSNRTSFSITFSLHHIQKIRVCLISANWTYNFGKAATSEVVPGDTHSRDDCSSTAVSADTCPRAHL